MKNRVARAKIISAIVVFALMFVICIIPADVLALGGLLSGTLLQTSPGNAVACVSVGDNIEYYDNISSAVSGWTDGSTLKLLKNVSGQISTSGGTKTLDLNGFNISKSGSAVVANGTNLTVKNSSATASKISNTSSGSGSAIEIKNGHLNLYDVTVESKFNGVSLEGSDADIYSGTISVTSQWKTCLNVAGPGKASIHGGTFKSANHMAIYLYNGGEAEIEGGSFKGGLSATTIVKGGYFDRDVTSLCAEAFKCVASDDTSKGAYMVKGAHNHNDIVFDDWTSANSLPTSAGNYCLTKDITISSTWTVPSGTTNLCLNGHGIKMTGSGSVISIPNNAILNLNDCDTETTHKFNVSGAGLAALDETNGNYIVKGGYITGGNISNGKGGGIYVAGMLNMNGGTVIGNNSNEGGGIYVLDGGNANLSGSAIIGNTTVTPGGGGGGLHLNKTANVTLTNCKILYNRAASNGGGISHSGSGTLIVDGGEIKYNETRDSATSIYKGGAIALGGSVQIRGDLVVSDNIHYANGTSTICNIVDAGAGKIIVAGELGENASVGVTFTKGSGVFTNSSDTSFNDLSKFVSDNADYYLIQNKSGQLKLISVNTVASVTSGNTENYYADINSAISAWKNGGTLTLLKDATFNEIINMRPMYGYGASEYVLDLNGNTFHIKSIQVGLNNSPNTLRTGPHLTIQDSGTGGILHFSESGMIDYGGLVELRGGTLTGGNGTWGGLFLLHIYASLDMYDGVTLTGNTSTYGGAILVGSDSEFNMYGGKISGNNATDSGGGVVIFDNDAARFNMYGGEISGNRAPKGGGVSVNVGQFHICGNSAVIKDNVSGGNLNSETGAYTGGTPNNVYLPSGKKIYIDSQLPTTPIGVTVQNGAGSFTSGLSGKGTVANFVSDNSAYEIRLVNGEAYVGPPHTHNWAYSVNGNVITATCAGVAEGCCDIPSQSITISASGKTYDGTPVTASLSHSDGWTADNGLTVPEIVYSGNTDAGTYTASVTLGGKTALAEFTIAKKSMADKITATGYTGNYDGNTHSITVSVPSGATVKYGTVADSFSLDTNPAYKNAGNYTVYYQVTKKNYVTVTGFATVKISPINAVVTITGNNSTADYDEKEHTVTGYTASANTALYDVEKDFTFSGNALVSLTDVGIVNMNLAPQQFTNKNGNFNSVTFIVTDGYIKILPVDAVITTAPVSEKPIYNGSKLNLIVPGKSYGGTLYYALGDDPRNAPADDSFNTAIPKAKELGSYYVWYKVVADRNHNDLSPTYVKVVIAEESWVTLSGVLYENDGKTPLGDSVVTLTKGNQQIDYVITDSNGNYEFIVPEGTYNIVANGHGVSATGMVKIFDNTSQDFVMSGGKTESIIKVNGDSNFGITAGGLNEEAYSIRKSGNIDSDTNVSVLMTVESKADNTAKNTAAFSTLMRRKSFMFFDVKLEATVGSNITVLKTTNNVLEIAVPYTKVNRRGLSVYYSDGSGVKSFKESDSKENGTYSIDKENGFIYIYSNQFSTFAIGYIPYYHVKSTVSLGSFKGNATVILDGQNGEGNFELKDIDLSKISFADIPKGEYKMSVTWKDGATNTLTMPITVS